MRNRIPASTTRLLHSLCRTVVCCAVRLLKCNGRAKKSQPSHNTLTINNKEEYLQNCGIVEMWGKCGRSGEKFHRKPHPLTPQHYNTSTLLTQQPLP